MANLILKQGKGFSMEEAAANVDFPHGVKFNATPAYKKAIGQVGFELKKFAREYVDKKIKGAPNVGFYVTLESAVADVRQRPYKEENIPTPGKRKYKTVYQIFTPDNRLVGQADKKDDAVKLGKELIGSHKVDFEIRLAKVVSEGEPIAARLTYTPSVGTKEGSYIFFSLEDSE